MAFLQFLITTTGAAGNVSIPDLGNRTYPNTLTNYDIGQEFEIDELRYSDGLADAIYTNGWTATDSLGHVISAQLSLGATALLLNRAGHAQSTDELPEGIINQYFLESRVRGTVLTGLSITGGAITSASSVLGSLGALQNQINSIGGTLNETIDDRVAALIINGNGINWNYADSANQLQASIDFTDFTADAITEGSTHLYYLDSRARAAISIEAGSTNYLSYNNSTGELGVKALAITDVTVDSTGKTSLSAYLTFVNYNITGGYIFQEGDVVILPGATGGTETWIHNGGVTGTAADFTAISGTDLDAAGIKALFSGTEPINYNSSTGAISLNIKTNGGLVLEGSSPNKTLAVDLGASSITGYLAATDGGTGQTVYAIGDILYADSTTTLSKRTIGSTDEVLLVSGGVPTWGVPKAKKTWNWGASSSSAINTDRFLDRHDGVATNQSPYVVPVATYIRYISLSSNAASTWTAHVYKNGASVATLASGGTQYAYSSPLAVAVAAGDRISLYVAGTSVNRPSIDVMFEEQ